jgi:hypothetical protein
MMTSLVHGHSTAKFLDGSSTDHHMAAQVDQHLMITLWSKSLDSGIIVQQLPVPTISAPFQPRIRPVPDTGAEHVCSLEGSEVHEPHLTVDPQPTDAATARPHTDHSPDSRRKNDDLKISERTTSPGGRPFNGRQEEHSSSGFSLRELQPASIVTVPPPATLSNIMSTLSQGGSAGAEQGDSEKIKRQERQGVSSMGPENSFGLRSQALAEHPQFENSGTQSSVNVRDSSEHEKRQLAELLGLEVDGANAPKQYGAARGSHAVSSQDMQKQHGDRVTAGMTRVPGRVSNHEPNIDVAGHSGSKQQAAQFTENEISDGAETSTALGVGRHGIARGGGQAETGSPYLSGVQESSSGAPGGGAAPGDSASLTWDAFRAVREQLEAMCCDDDEDDLIQAHCEDAAPHPVASMAAHSAPAPHAAISRATAPGCSPQQHQEAVGVTVAEGQNVSGDISAAQPRPDQPGDKFCPSLAMGESQNVTPPHSSALQLQFEKLRPGHDRSHAIVPEPSSSPRHNDPHTTEAHSLIDTTPLSFPTPEQRHSAHGELHIAPDSPDSLRSSSVFVSGTLRRPQLSSADQSHHSDIHASDSHTHSSRTDAHGTDPVPISA